MVAAAGESVGLRPRTAVICLAAVLLGFALVAYFSIHYSALEKMRLEQTPEVLTQKSREIIARLGYEGHPADSAFGLRDDDDFQEYVEKNDKPPHWDAVLAARPSLLQYWYRQSPNALVASDFRGGDLMTPGIVTKSDPPTVLSGMINLELDPQGRLTYFEAIPLQKQEEKNGDTSAAAPAAAAAPTGYDWNTLFAAAGLDASKFQTAPPIWASLAASDSRMAWTGTWPGTTRALRVEAAAFQGKPVFFSLIGDWTKPERQKSTEKKSIGEQAGKILGWLVVGSVLVGSGLLARRNYRQGRGDRAGALRLASVMFLLEIALFLCRGHFATVGDAIGLLFLQISTALFVAGTTWMLYLAVEPWVRRHWPKTIISWSRLLSAGARDPLVGRDILFGVLLGVVWILIFQIRFIPMMRMGAAPTLFSPELLTGGRNALGAWLQQWPLSIQTTLVFFFLLFGLKVLLRKEWIAAIVMVAIFALPRGLSSSYRAVEIPAEILVYAIAAIIVLRFGFVPLACAVFTINLVANIPLSADLSAWYMTSSILALLSVVALAGERTLAGQLSAGQMVAFYGYTTYLVSPINRMTFAITKAMQAAISKYSPSVLTSASYGATATIGWAAGTVFATVAKTAGLTPSSSQAQIVAALDTVKNETFGGITPPLTFTAGKPAQVACSFVAGISDGKWTEPIGLKTICMPGM